MQTTNTKEKNFWINKLYLPTLKKLLLYYLKQLFKYKSLLKSVIYLLLVSQVIGYSITYGLMLIEETPELIELCNLGDIQSEGEIDENEKDDKFSEDSINPRICLYVSSLNILHFESFHFLNHRKIITPPPEVELS